MKMNQGVKTNLTKGGVCLAAYLIWTLLVRFVNVQPIGPQGTSVGLSALNGALFRALGGDVHRRLYGASGVLGYLIILLGLCTALIAVLQLIQRKSLKRVDWDLKMFVLYGVAVLVIYLITTVASINYRPVILDAAKGPELSYPSSHTLLSVSVAGAIAAQLRLRVRDERLQRTLVAAVWALGALVVLLRLLANVHWLSDIIGAVFLALALCEGHRAAVCLRYKRF